MASKSKRTLVRRLFNFSKALNKTFKSSRIDLQAGIPPAPDPGDNTIFQRLLHLPTSPGLCKMPAVVEIENNLREKLASSVGSSRARIQLDGLIPPASVGLELVNEGVTVEETRKLVRLAVVVKLKTRLREIPRSWITYQEYVGICAEDCSDSEHGLELAKMLDESGAVIVLGSVVFLRPDQVGKVVMGSIMATTGVGAGDPRWKELEEMEKHKGEIDEKAAELVRHELWLGLGFLVAQTAGLMRLTFWDLSWDVMEPICYYLTSAYFMAGYAFFLTTSKEPSFEGLYHSRFHAKQKRLMKLYKFDAHKYIQLRKTLDQNTQFWR